MSDSVHIYRDGRKQWRWRKLAANNKKIANSGEGYHNFLDAEEAAKRACAPGDRLVYDSRPEGASPGLSDVAKEG